MDGITCDNKNSLSVEIVASVTAKKARNIASHRKHSTTHSAIFVQAVLSCPTNQKLQYVFCYHVANSSPQF